MRESKPEASKRVMGPMPDFPARRLSQVSVTLPPSGVSAETGYNNAFAAHNSLMKQKVVERLMI